MSLVQHTPSSGKQVEVQLSLNRMRLRPGDRVVYWSDWASAPKVDTIDCYSDMSGNWFTINGEKTLVTLIWARVPEGRDDAAVVETFAAVGRRDIAMNEVDAIVRQLGLAS